MVDLKQTKWVILTLCSLLCFCFSHSIITSNPLFTNTPTQIRIRFNDVEKTPFSITLFDKENNSAELLPVSDCFDFEDANKVVLHVEPFNSLSVNPEIKDAKFTCDLKVVASTPLVASHIQLSNEAEKSELFTAFSILTDKVPVSFVSVANYSPYTHVPIGVDVLMKIDLTLPHNSIGTYISLSIPSTSVISSDSDVFTIIKENKRMVAKVHVKDDRLLMMPSNTFDHIYLKVKFPTHFTPSPIFINLVHYDTVLISNTIASQTPLSLSLTSPSVVVGQESEFTVSLKSDNKKVEDLNKLLAGETVVIQIANTNSFGLQSIKEDHNTVNCKGETGVVAMVTISNSIIDTHSATILSLQYLPAATTDLPSTTPLSCVFTAKTTPVLRHTTEHEISLINVQSNFPITLANKRIPVASGDKLNSLSTLKDDPITITSTEYLPLVLDLLQINFPPSSVDLTYTIPDIMFISDHHIITDDNITIKHDGSQTLTISIAKNPLNLHRVFINLKNSGVILLKKTIKVLDVKGDVVAQHTYNEGKDFAKFRFNFGADITDSSLVDSTSNISPHLGLHMLMENVDLTDVSLFIDMGDVTLAPSSGFVDNVAYKTEGNTITLSASPSGAKTTALSTWLDIVPVVTETVKNNKYTVYAQVNNVANIKPSTLKFPVSTAYSSKIHPPSDAPASFLTYTPNADLFVDLHYKCDVVSCTSKKFLIRNSYIPITVPGNKRFENDNVSCFHASKYTLECTIVDVSKAVLVTFSAYHPPNMATTVAVISTYLTQPEASTSLNFENKEQIGELVYLRHLPYDNQEEQPKSTTAFSPLDLSVELPLGILPDTQTLITIKSPAELGFVVSDVKVKDSDNKLNWTADKETITISWSSAVRGTTLLLAGSVTSSSVIVANPVLSLSVSHNGAAITTVSLDVTANLIIHDTPVSVSTNDVSTFSFSGLKLTEGSVVTVRGLSLLENGPIPFFNLDCQDISMNAQLDPKTAETNGIFVTLKNFPADFDSSLPCFFSFNDPLLVDPVMTLSLSDPKTTYSIPVMRQLAVDSTDIYVKNDDTASTHTFTLTTPTSSTSGSTTTQFSVSQTKGTPIVVNPVFNCGGEEITATVTPNPDTLTSVVSFTYSTEDKKTWAGSLRCKVSMDVHKDIDGVKIQKFSVNKVDSALSYALPVQIITEPTLLLTYLHPSPNIYIDSKNGLKLSLSNIPLKSGDQVTLAFDALPFTTQEKTYETFSVSADATSNTVTVTLLADTPFPAVDYEMELGGLVKVDLTKPIKVSTKVAEVEYSFTLPLPLAHSVDVSIFSVDPKDVQITVVVASDDEITVTFTDFHMDQGERYSVAVDPSPIDGSNNCVVKPPTFATDISTHVFIIVNPTDKDTNSCAVLFKVVPLARYIDPTPTISVTSTHVTSTHNLPESTDDTFPFSLPSTYLLPIVPPTATRTDIKAGTYVFMTTSSVTERDSFSINVSHLSLVADKHVDVSIVDRQTLTKLLSFEMTNDISMLSYEASLQAPVEPIVLPRNEKTGFVSYTSVPESKNPFTFRNVIVFFIGSSLNAQTSKTNIKFIAGTYEGESLVHESLEYNVRFSLPLMALSDRYRSFSLDLSQFYSNPSTVSLSYTSIDLGEIVHCNSGTLVKNTDNVYLSEDLTVSLKDIPSSVSDITCWYLPHTKSSLFEASNTMSLSMSNAHSTPFTSVNLISTPEYVINHQTATITIFFADDLEPSKTAIAEMLEPALKTSPLYIPSSVLVKKITLNDKLSYVITLVFNDPSRNSISSVQSMVDIVKKTLTENSLPTSRVMFFSSSTLSVCATRCGFGCTACRTNDVCTIDADCVNEKCIDNKCTASTPDGDDDDDNNDNDKKKKNNKPSALTIALIVVGVLLVAAIVSYFVYKKCSESRNEYSVPLI